MEIAETLGVAEIGVGMNCALISSMVDPSAQTFDTSGIEPGFFQRYA
jgi:hypothetical protein